MLRFDMAVQRAHLIRPFAVAKKGSKVTPILTKRLFWGVSNSVTFVIKIGYNTRRRMNLIPLPVALIIVNTIRTIKVHRRVVEVHW
jgi:hypothetical protein